MSSEHRPRRQHVGRMGVGARAARETHIGGAVAVRERRATPTPRVLDLSSMLDARACVEHEPCEAARSKSVRVAVASCVHTSRNTARGTGRVVLRSKRSAKYIFLPLHCSFLHLSPSGVPPSGVDAIRARVARARENSQICVFHHPDRALLLALRPCSRPCSRPRRCVRSVPRWRSLA